MCRLRVHHTVVTAAAKRNCIENLHVLQVEHHRPKVIFIVLGETHLCVIPVEGGFALAHSKTIFIDSVKKDRLEMTNFDGWLITDLFSFEIVSYETVAVDYSFPFVWRKFL